MRILLLSQVFPYPPYDGNILPIHHFLRCLAPRAQFTLLTREPADAGLRSEALALWESWGVRARLVRCPVRSGAAQAWACLRGGRPWINRFFSPELAAAAAELLARERFDLIQSEGVLSAQHLPAAPPARRLLVARDCLSLAHWRAWRAGHSPREALGAIKIAQMERTLYRRADRILAISPTDAEAIRRLAPSARIEVLPNGVDLDQFRPRPELEQPGVVAFTGAMDFAPNVEAAVWFGREIWPGAVRRVPSARLRIIGRDPVPAVLALAADPSIEVTGRVERMEEEAARAQVIVSPLRRGTGIKNKVLEGAALARALVVSPVSLADIDLRPGRELELAESAGEFIEQTASLLSDPARRRALGQAARSAVEQRYGWSAMAERLWGHYGELVGGGDVASAKNRA
ncbi:MAG TPA: glycosyltransferase [Candidatus Sumerlaeota bacterium]|nr:MAG: D-inositol-3-phosphate glycosyltransferase [candidate division BRC1 bacterium ADurb.BinA292]HOE95912.1 glycosyltransferase [Candidatus Sumerlaeota bacterium]HOR28433.1 glycosyltransferase [Candidatus Sumerlaeota bacterium]HPK01720.1 glycosyltransferase [Candidatus Sumerlaeota bacterium]